MSNDEKYEKFKNEQMKDRAEEAHDRKIEFLKKEHGYKMEFAKADHEYKMARLEKRLEIALIENEGEMIK